MNALTQSWSKGTTLRGDETWCEWNAHTSQPQMDLEERAEWMVARGFNYTRWFAWQATSKGDAYANPRWGIQAWRNRALQGVRINQEQGIYTVLSCSMGCSPDGSPAHVIGNRELKEMRALAKKVGDEPGVIWEVCNEAPPQAYLDGWIQKGIDILKKTGNPILEAYSNSTAVALHGMGKMGDIKGHALEGLHETAIPDVHGFKPPILVQVDHLGNLLDMKNSDDQERTIKETNGKGYAGFVGLSTYVQESDGESYGLKTWSQQSRLARWSSAKTHAALARFEGGKQIIVRPVTLGPGPSINSYDRDCRLYHRLAVAATGEFRGRPGAYAKDPDVLADMEELQALIRAR